MIKTGRPLDRQRTRVQQGTVTLLEPYSLSAKSQIFEIRNRPIILQAFNLEPGDEVILLSVVRTPSGADIEQEFKIEGNPVSLTEANTSTLVGVSGRYRVQAVSGVGDIRVTYTLQNADIGADVGMPSGAQANRPNVFLDRASPETISHIVEIAERPWVFNAYGLGVANSIETYQVYGIDSTYREEPYLLDGQPATLDIDNNAIRLDTSGRYRFKLIGVGGDVTLIGNPTTPEQVSSSGGGGIPGPPGPPTPPVVLVAGDTIHGRRAVMAVNGQALHPSLAVDADADRVIGISLNSSNVGGAVQVRTAGQVTENSWAWNPGYVYVGDFGVLTQTPSATGWLLVVGRAINAITIDVDVDTAFFRG